MILISSLGILVSRVRLLALLAVARSRLLSMIQKNFLTRWFTRMTQPLPDSETQLHLDIKALLDKPWNAYVQTEADGKFSTVTLRQLTRHHSGYVREKAVAALTVKHDISALGELITSVNDWVKPIHLAATDAVAELLTSENTPHFIVHLPEIRFLTTCRRYDHRAFVDAIGRFLVSKNLPALYQALYSPERDIRDAVLYTLIEQDQFWEETALLSILDNQDSHLRAIAVEHWLQRNRPLSAELTLRLLQDPWARIRRSVLFYLDEHRQLPPEALYRRLLLDKNALIQQRTRRMLEGKTDATALWLEVLHDNNASITQRRAALYGLKESHYPDLWAQAEWAYAKSEPGLRKVSLQILVGLEGDDAKPRILETLSSPNPTLVFAAWHVLTRASLSLTLDDVQPLLENPPTPSHRLVYLRLLTLLNKWDWLILLLRTHHQLAEHECDGQCHLWVVQFNRAGISPTSRQRETLRELLPLVPKINKIVAEYIC